MVGCLYKVSMRYIERLRRVQSVPKAFSIVSGGFKVFRELSLHFQRLSGNFKRLQGCTSEIQDILRGMKSVSKG